MSGEAAVQTQVAKPTITPVASGMLQRQCACGQHTVAGGECEACKQKREGMLQRAAVNPAPVRDVPPIVHEVLHSPGQPLDAQTRAFMEPRFGHDFSGVRVHTDAQAAESARAVNALAYTVGRDVVFGAGQYAPHTSAGRRLAAHELTHVVQQGPTAATRIQYVTDIMQEASADAAADAVLAGRRPAAMPEAARGLQRQRALTEENELPSESPESPTANAEVGTGSLTGTGTGEELAGLLPSLSILPPACTPATSLLQAKALYAFVVASYIPYARGMFGPQTASLWLEYLNTALPLPRPARSFAGKGEIVDGFTKHHKSAEAEKEIVDASAAALSGPASPLLPAPGATSIVPVTSLVPATTLRARIRNKADPMGLDYDSAATTIPGNIAGGIGSGGPPGNTVSDPDTRDVDGMLQLDLDSSGTRLTITPALTFQVHDTVDFCPGALGGAWARIETVPMSILEATEGRFGPVFAADVPFDVSYPGPGVVRSTSLSPSPPAPTPTPTPTPTPVPVPPSTDCEPASGDAIGDRILFRINTADFLTSAEQTKFNALADSLRVSDDQVKVHGFASVDGPADFNDRLSCTRALRAAQLLGARGVSAGQIVKIFKHGATPGPAQERRSVVFEREHVGPGPTPPGPMPPGPTPPAPAPPTPTAIPKVTLKSIRFTSDHGVMKDNRDSWNSSGSVFPKPDWQASNPDGKSGPISHDSAKNVQIQIVLDVTPNSVSGVPFTLRGQASVGFLDFETSGILNSGSDIVLSLTSKQSTPPEINGYLHQTIPWSVTTANKTQLIGISADHDVFVTSGAAHNTAETSGGDKPNLPTFRRLMQATKVAAGIPATQADQIVYNVFRRFPNYGVCDVPFVPNNYGISCPVLNSVWEMSDFERTGNFQCITISRYVNAVLNVLGVPKAVENIVVKPVVIWADPAHKELGIDSDYPHPGINIPSIHHPTHPEWPLGLIDGNCGINNYEACVKLQWTPSGQSQTIVQYYCGGVANPRDGFRTPRQVLDSAFVLAYYVQMSKNDPRTGFPRGIRMEDVKVYKESGRCHTEL